MAASAAMDAATYCLDQVRQFDRDRYLTVLFAPRPVRGDLLALYAFNLEVARTREMVREPMMGLVRLQWWRDVIAEIYAGGERRHHVVQPLAAAIRRHGLARDRFDRLIDAREADMDAAPPADLPALNAYAEATSVDLGLLVVQALGASAEGPAAAAVRGIWLAAGLTGLLRAIPFHARHRRIHLPQTLMAEHGLNVRELFALWPPAALPAIVRVVADEACRQLASGRTAAACLPRGILPALLPAVLTRAYLRRLEISGYDVFASRVQQGPPARVWRLLLASLRGGI